MPPSPPSRPYETIPFPPERTATLDTLRWARKRLAVPLLLEVDVTAARAAIRAVRARTGTTLSFTAWVVRCVARAAAAHPRVHALRRGRRRLVLFRAVDVAVPVERATGAGGAGGGAETLPMPVVVRAANEKSVREIHAEIRRAQGAALPAGTASIERGPPPWLQAAFFRLPAWLRDLVFWRPLWRDPVRVQRTMGTVAVTAVGMAAPGVLAWGIPLSLHPLAVGVGGIVSRRTAAGTAEVLALTVVFDHAVVDGAPVGRFVRRLHDLLAGADGLADEPADVGEPRAPGEESRPALRGASPPGTAPSPARAERR